MFTPMSVGHRGRKCTVQLAEECSGQLFLLPYSSFTAFVIGKKKAEVKHEAFQLPTSVNQFISFKVEEMGG